MEHTSSWLLYDHVTFISAYDSRAVEAPRGRCSSPPSSPYPPSSRSSRRLPLWLETLWVTFYITIPNTIYVLYGLMWRQRAITLTVLWQCHPHVRNVALTPWQCINTNIRTKISYQSIIKITYCTVWRTFSENTKTRYMEIKNRYMCFQSLMSLKKKPAILPFIATWWYVLV